jgi:hypothetical protein
MASTSTKVTCVATKPLGGIPAFRMKVLAQKPCEDCDDEHSQFKVVDPEGATDWVCSKDVDVLETKPAEPEQGSNEQASESESESDSIPSSGRMVVDELEWRRLTEELAALRAEVQALKELKALKAAQGKGGAGARKKRKNV